LNVLTVSGIKLRDKPGGTVLQSIPFASKVVTLEPKNNNFPVTVEGIAGSWVKVNFNGKGKVLTQSISPGTPLAPNSTIELVLG
jgi:hypothetical protein